MQIILQEDVEKLVDADLGAEDGLGSGSGLGSGLGLGSGWGLLLLTSSCAGEGYIGLLQNSQF